MIWGAAIGADYSYPATIPWIWANGGDLVSADLTKSLVDEPPTREALEWLFEQRDTHAVWPSADEVSGDELFKIGRLAMLYGPRSFTGTLIVPQATSGLQYGLVAAPRPRPGGQAAQRAFQPSARAQTLAARAALAHVACRDQRAGRGLDVPPLVDGAKQHSGPSSREPSARDPKACLTLPTMPPPARRSVAQSVAPWFGGEPLLAALEHARDLPLHPARAKLLQVYVARGLGLAPVWAGKQSVAVATAAIAKAQDTILAG